MATNKRLLKKEIRMICGSIAAECVVAKIAIPGINPEAMNAIIFQLADLQHNAIEKMNITFPQGRKSFASAKEYEDARHKYFKAAFAQLKKEFNDRIEAILKEMNLALPKEQKEANKQAAQAKA